MSEDTSLLTNIFGNWIPMLLLLGMLYFLIRRVGSGNSGYMGTLQEYSEIMKETNLRLAEIRDELKAMREKK